MKYLEHQGQPETKPKLISESINYLLEISLLTYNVLVKKNI